MQKKYIHRFISKNLNRCFESSDFGEEARSMFVEECKKEDVILNIEYKYMKNQRQEKKWKMQKKYIHRFISKDLNRRFESSNFSEEARSMFVEECKKEDVILNIEYKYMKNQRSGLCSVSMGSRAEGTSLELQGSDLDVLSYQDFIEADPGKCNEHQSSNDTYLCMVKNLTTPKGYTKLQRYCNGNPAKSSLDCFVKNTFATSNLPVGIIRHGPAITQKDVGHISVDRVFAFACKDLPKEVTPWFQRKRPYGWPSPATCELFKKMGCFVVGVGHLKSSEKDLEWRISFSYQERHLMQNLNPTQYRCYILLKLCKTLSLKKFGGGEMISSYHCKTALFYTIENNSQTIWRPDNLSVCLFLCLQQLYEWIEEKNCPNYFIPEENMFETSDEQQVQIAKTAFDKVFSGYYYMLAEFSKWLSPSIYGCGSVSIKASVMVRIAKNMKLGMNNLTRYVNIMNIEKVISDQEDSVQCMETISEVLQRQDQVKTFHPFTENTLPLLMDNPLLVQDESIIDILCSNKNIILEVFKHAKQQIRAQVACLFLAKFLQDTGNELGNSLEGMKYEQEALKVDACQYYMKKASVFLKKGQYCLCSETLTKSMITTLPIPLQCTCIGHGRKKRNNYQVNVNEERLKNGLKTTLTSDMNTEQLLYKFPTCLTFDTLEMNMVPIPLTFEGYRSFGIPKQLAPIIWYDWVEIDSSVYLQFLQYKNYELLNDIGAGNHALIQLEDIIVDGLQCDTVVHLDTALNALGHIYVTKGWNRLALQCLKQSWVIRPSHNAAKWHVMFNLFAEKYS